MTNTETFLLALGAGAAFLAFWLVARFPDRAPANFRVAMIHVMASFGIGWVAPTAFGVAISFGRTAAFVAIFGILLPVLVYAFLSAAWFLKLAHDAISQRQY